MNVRFFDRQDLSNPCHGTLAENSEWLLARLAELQQRPASFCELEADNGFNLLVGVGNEEGCAQYSASGGRPPYLMTVNDSGEGSEEYLEFLTANTDTPVLRRYCLPIDSIKETALVFFETGQRSEGVSWEEV